jgi:hypothetical protein
MFMMYPRILATASAIVLTGLAGGCGEDYPQGPTPITRQLIVIIDVSGSTRELVKTFPHSVNQLLKSVKPETLDGTRLTVVVADGSSPATVCKAEKVDISVEGDSATKRRDDLNRDIASATTLVADQINCGLGRNTPGSDLIGSLYAADGSVKSDLDSLRVILYSDGVQYGEDFRFSKKFLADARARKQKLKQLAEDEVLPTRLRGACLTVSNPAYQTAGLSLKAQAGLKDFWKKYSERVGAVYIDQPSLTCDD